jgi:pimeloyl-ACP methyl ester carboxylesterase
LPKKELLFSVIQGTGIPVIMLHGLTASHHDWDSLTSEVTQAGYRVYAPDLLGHGDSPRPTNPAIYNLDNLYDSLLDWIEQVHIPKPFFLIGHSLGGYLCLKIAIDQPNHVLGLEPIRKLRRVECQHKRVSQMRASYLNSCTNGWQCCAA